MKPLITSTIVSLLAVGRIFAQGDLLPPGPPAPTMKRLDQIEARTIVNAAHTPGDATNTFIISAPGSYYLIGNILGVTGQSGISMTANDVTLDLNGFALIGSADAASGIRTATVRNLAVRNGVVRGWQNSGIDASSATNSLFEQIRASTNNQSGIATGSSCIVKDCAATGNSSDGIFQVGGGGVITGCVAQGNGANGFNVATVFFDPTMPTTITGCTATSNGFNGFTTQDSVTITNCTATSNSSDGFDTGSHGTLTNCTARNNRSGIVCLDTSTVSNCTATANRDHGILARAGCHILHNNASSNGTDGAGDGIQTTGPCNRIDGNQASFNIFRGIRCLGGAPFDDIIRNTALSNGVGGYAPSSAERMGPLSTPSTATSPWANF